MRVQCPRTRFPFCGKRSRLLLFARNFIRLSIATFELGCTALVLSLPVSFTEFSLHAVFLVPKMHAGAHVPAMSSGPAAHTGERRDDGPSQWSQGVLDSNDPHSCFTPANQSCGFEIAKSSRKHPLGNTSEVATQLPMSMRPLLQRKQNFGGPSADVDWRGHFWSVAVVSHEPDLALISNPWE